MDPAEIAVTPLRIHNADARRLWLDAHKLAVPSGGRSADTRRHP